MKTLKKLLCSFLAVITILSCIPLPAQAADTSAAAASNSYYFTWPLKSGKDKNGKNTDFSDYYNHIGSPFGERYDPGNESKKILDDHPHRGIDTHNVTGGTIIYAAATGTLKAKNISTAKTGYGTYVIIEHTFGNEKFYSLYAHMQSLSNEIKNLNLGAKVTEGLPLGKVGTTGGSTGNHLHFEIRKGKNSDKYAVNPLLYMNAVAPYIKFNMTKYPTAFTKAKSFNLEGVIDSNYRIATVNGFIVKSDSYTPGSILNYINSRGELKSGSGIQVVQKVYDLAENKFDPKVQNTDANKNLKFAKLDDGIYTLILIASTSYDRTKFTAWEQEFTVGSVGSKLNITSPSFPSSVMQDDTYSLTGTVSSNYKISSVKAEVANRDTGKNLYSYTAKPNATSYDLASLNVGKNLSLGKLAIGNYKLTLTATDASGKAKTWTQNFAVTKKKSNLTVDVSGVPLYLEEGSNFTILGNIKSNFKIKEVSVYLYSKNNDGYAPEKRVTEKPKKTSYSLPSSLSKKFKFDKLEPGIYNLWIIAYDEDGNVADWSQNFEVTKKVSTLGINVTNAPEAIEEGSDFTIKGTVETNYKLNKISLSVTKGSKTVYSYGSSSGLLKYSKWTIPSSISKDIKFKKLDTGTYTLKISATDTSGKSKTWSKNFEVAKKVSTLKLNMTALPAALTEGESFTLKGSVSSNYKVNQLVVTVLQNNYPVRTVRLYPNKTSYSLASDTSKKIAFNTLTPGKYILQFDAFDESDKHIYQLHDFEVKKLTSSLNIAMTKYPNSLDKGKAHDIAGTVKSNFKITSVVGSIIDASGKTAQTVTVKPNKTSLDLKSSTINKNLKFGSLTVGKYTLKIVATDAFGKTITWSNPLEIKGTASALKIAMTAYPTAIIKGDKRDVAGTISSNYKITKITGAIYDVNGKAVQSVTVKPNKTSFDIKTSDINKKLKFGNLAIGTYTLKIAALDACDKLISWETPLTVKGPDSTLKLTVSSFPASFIEGSKPAVTTSVASNYKITQFAGNITDSTGKKVVDFSTKPNKTSYSMDSKTYRFDQLPVGNYTVNLAAKDESGKTVTYNKTFKVDVLTSTLNIAVTKYPTSLEKGKAHDIAGTVKSNFKITSVVGAIIDASGKTTQTVTVKPNKTSLDLKSSNINNKLKFGSLAIGDYTIKITATDASGKTMSWSSALKIKGPDSTIKISMTAYPTSITKGTKRDVAGTVKSNYKITAVAGAIYDVNGNAVQNVSVKPNKTSFDIKSSDINNKLKFGDLAVGKYTLKIAAKDESGKLVSWETPLEIKAVASTLKISMTSAPSSIKKGSSYNLKGTISSNYKITSATGSILNSSGSAVQTVKVTPNATSHSVNTSKINNNLKFGSLAKGSYTLRIVAVDASGKSVTYNKAFTVK